MKKQYKQCNTCIFGDICKSNRVCKYYSPLDGLRDDRTVYKRTEKTRVEFFDEWLEYIEEYT